MLICNNDCEAARVNLKTAARVDLNNVSDHMSLPLTVILLLSCTHHVRQQIYEQELNNIYHLDGLVCLPTGEQTEPLAGANVRAQHRVMDTSIVRGRAGCIQAGGSPGGKTLRGLKLSLRLPTD